MSAILRIGSVGPAVSDLQTKLNKKCNPSHGLVVDGIFGKLTDAAVRAFQVQAKLSVDGDVGPLTNAALDAAPDNGGGKVVPPPLHTNIMHQVNFIPQPTNTTCWAASTAMMTNSVVPVVIMLTPNDMIASDGGLKNSSGSDQAIVTGTRYGNIHNLRCYPPMSWSLEMMTDVLRRSPLMFDMLWNASDYVAGKGSPGHMIVVCGMRGDGDPVGLGTELYVQDPWPPNVGKKSWVNFNKWLNEVPTRTYRVFERK
jgi:hypothetical protein